MRTLHNPHHQVSGAPFMATGCAFMRKGNTLCESDRDVSTDLRP